MKDQGKIAFVKPSRIIARKSEYEFGYWKLVVFDNLL